MISFDKTAVLLRVEGKGMKTCIKHLTKWQDGQRWLVVPRLKGHTLIKLVSHHTYLGAQLSFTHFEQLTLRHRLQIGKITCMRMRPWFTGKHVLTSCDRAKLWATCVLSSYAHGLGCSGLRKEGLQQLCNRVHSDIRRLGRSPQHVTHETTGHLLSRLHLKPPRVFFQDRWEQAFHKFRSTCGGLPDWDLMHRIPIDRTQQRVMQVFQDPPPADEPDGPPCAPTIHGCPYCEQTFGTLALYHRHLAKRHKALPLFQQFVNLRDAYLGKPQCTHCLGKFAQWVGLVHRIEFDSCPNFNVHRALQVPPCDNEDLRHYVRTQSWDAFFERPDLMNWIRQHCVICARAFQTGKDVLRRLARCHSCGKDP